MLPTDTTTTTSTAIATTNGTLSVDGNNHQNRKLTEHGEIRTGDVSGIGNVIGSGDVSADVGGGDGSSGRPGWVKSVLDKNGQGLGLASSLAAAMETNAQFVFKGTMRGACAFLAILSLFLASCQIISLLQEEHEW